MAKKCSICSSKNRCQIDEMIVNKTPYSTITHQFKIKAKDPIQAIKNHVRYGHVSESIKVAANENRIQDGLNLHACAKEIYDLCLSAAKKAEKDDLRAFGSCISPAVKTLEILNKGNEHQSEKSGLDEIRENIRANKNGMAKSTT